MAFSRIEDFVEVIDGSNPARPFIVCPGKELHTTPTAKRDTVLYLQGALSDVPKRHRE